MTASYKNTFFGQSGFTIVEFLVVFSISAILIAVALPALNTFNTNQVLKATAQELKTNLRQAQNNALSGVKNCAILPITNSNSTLIGWYIRFDTSNPNNITYTIAHHCSYGTAEQNDPFSPRTYQLKGVSQLILSPADAVILFKPVARGVSFYSNFTDSFDLATLLPDSEMTITLRNNNSATINITIFSSGEINVE